MDLTKREDQEGWSALERLLRIARRDTGQSKRVADFLLAWHNAPENGGWDPVDLWSVDAAIADDMLQVIRLIRESHRYPGDLGLEEEITAVWRLWRGGKAATGPEAQRL
jgi:ParB family transcriptional regulator, chromosome partitioning protein